MGTGSWSGALDIGDWISDFVFGSEYLASNRIQVMYALAILRSMLTMVWNCFVFDDLLKPPVATDVLFGFQ